MFGKSFKVLAMAAALGLAAKTQAVQFFFSPNGTPGLETVTNPTQNTNKGAQNTLYIWAIPAAGDGTISGISLNVRVGGAAGDISAMSCIIDNPATGAGGSKTRWSGATSGGASTSTRVNNGVYKTNASSSGTSPSIGTGTSQNDGTDFATDTLRDPLNNAFRIGSITYTLAAGATGADVPLFMQVGGADAGGPGNSDATGGKIVNHDGTTFNVFFGAGDSVAASSQDKGGESTNGTASTADAIIKVPEPSSMALLGLGALGLIRRRKA